MVKHTQTVRQQITDELFECVLPLCGLALKMLAASLILGFIGCESSFDTSGPWI